MQRPLHNIYLLKAADRQLIEQEHTRLERFLRNLSDACSELDSMKKCHGCERGKFASCQGRLTSFLYDFLDLVAEHFENEENIMCGSLRIPNEEYFHKHQTAHAKLMRDLTEMMRESAILNKQGDTAEAIRRLYRWISASFAEHARSYDYTLLM